jgi:hypothetical protein
MPLPFSNGVCLFIYLFLKLKTARTNLVIVIALVFTFYILSFIIDLLPSVRTRRHIPQGEKALHTGRPSTSSGPQHEVTYEEPVTTDSMGDRGNTYRGQVVNGHHTNGTYLPRDF